MKVFNLKFRIQEEKYTKIIFIYIETCDMVYTIYIAEEQLHASRLLISFKSSLNEFSRIF